MAWYNEKGNKDSVVLATRVRLARNLADYPFTGRLSASGAAEIAEKVKAALPEYGSVNFSSLSAAEARAYVERHYVSPAFTDKKLPRILLTGEGERVQIMVCEEDHLRIQSIVAGFAPEAAFAAACRGEQAACETLNIAFDKELGYLTHCPTNLGNAMRVSAMMFLPALSEGKRIEQLAPGLNKLGMTVRGAYGEGSESSGCIYQISNSTSLGVSEKDILKNFTDVVKRLSKLEEDARLRIAEREGERLADRVCRSLGILRYSRLLSSGELSARLTDLRLGGALGLIETLPPRKLTELSIAARPATLMMSGEGLENESARDKARAALVRATLSGSGE